MSLYRNHLRFLSSCSPFHQRLTSAAFTYTESLEFEAKFDALSMLLEPFI